MTRHFDLAVIGGGAAAFAAAIRANDLNAKTAIINHGLPLGGTCVNVPAIPPPITGNCVMMASRCFSFL